MLLLHCLLQALSHPSHWLVCWFLSPALVCIFAITLIWAPRSCLNHCEAPSLLRLSQAAWLRWNMLFHAELRSKACGSCLAQALANLYLPVAAPLLVQLCPSLALLKSHRTLACAWTGRVICSLQTVAWNALWATGSFLHWGPQPEGPVFRRAFSRLVVPN